LVIKNFDLKAKLYKCLLRNKFRESEKVILIFHYLSGSQPFLAHGTLFWFKKFGGTPKSKIRPKKVLFLHAM
jgi:hypothetical protein